MNNSQIIEYMKRSEEWNIKEGSSEYANGVLNYYEIKLSTYGEDWEGEFAWVDIKTKRVISYPCSDKLPNTLTTILLTMLGKY